MSFCGLGLPPEWALLQSQLLQRWVEGTEPGLLCFRERGVQPWATQQCSRAEKGAMLHLGYTQGLLLCLLRFIDIISE